MKTIFQKQVLFFTIIVSILFIGNVSTASANSAPVLDSTKSPVLSGIEDGAGVPVGAVGTLISSLVDLASPVGQVDNITDVDSEDPLGIAITASNTTDFTWYYSINGGTSWSALGAVGTTTARLLAADASSRVYGVPNSGVGTYSAVLTFRAWDQTSGTNGSVVSTTTNGGTSAFSTATDTVNITVSAANNAPSATNLSAAESYTEDTPLNLTDIVASDADGGSLTATLTLSNTGAGSLSTATSGTVTSTYVSGTGVWTASGVIADVNVLLAGVTFIPTSNFNSNFTVTTNVSDGTDSVSGSKAFTGTAVNDAPNATNLSAAESYTEDIALNLVDIVVTDVDSVVTATLTLSIPAAGSLSTATSGAVTSTYVAGTGVWTAGGAVTDVNTLLAGVTLTPTANYNSSFTIATNVTDGVAAAVTGTKVVTGVAVNDPPTATNLSAAESYTEDTPLNLTDIVASDVDSSNLTATLTLSIPAAGSLSTATSGAVTSTYIAGTGVWTASGATANVNTLLAGVTFTPATGYTSSFIIATSVTDGVAAPVTGSKSFTGVTENTAPVANDDDYDGGGVVLEDDVDIALSVLDNDTDGDDDDLTIVSVTEPSHGSVEISLDTVLYTPDPDYCGFDAFDYSIEDTSFEGDTATVDIYINCVNDSPEATNLSAPESYGENFPYDLTDIVMSDVDTTDMIVTLTLSDTIYGTLSTGTSGAVTSTYDGDTGVWAATGDIEDVNILLADLNFVPFENIVGNFTIEISIKDDELAIPLTGTKVMTGIPWSNHAPELDTTKSPILESIDEDVGAPVGDVGTLVSSLVDFASPTGQMDNVTDIDDGALLGIAITAVDSELACYSSLNDGATWVQIIIDPDTSLLLAADADNRVYCNPGANQYGIYAEALTFRAWDQTDGTDGGVGDNIVAGGTTGSSTDTDTISLTVNNIPESSSGGSVPLIFTIPQPSTIISTQHTQVPLFVFTRNLTIGAVGEDVRELQKFLNNNGFPVAITGLGSKGNESTYFGAKTRAALAKFQVSKNISPAVGYFGPVTRGVVNGR